MSTLEGAAKLAYQVNQIARHFEAQGQHGTGGDAAIATRDHLKSFWTPAMRAEILARAGRLELSATAARAVVLLGEG